MRTEMVLGDGVLGSFLNLKLRFFWSYDSVPRAHYPHAHNSVVLSRFFKAHSLVQAVSHLHYIRSGGKRNFAKAQFRGLSKHCIHHYSSVSVTAALRLYEKTLGFAVFIIFLIV